MKLYKFCDKCATIINLNRFVDMKYNYVWGNYLDVTILLNETKTKTISLLYETKEDLVSDYILFMKRNMKDFVVLESKN